MGLRMSLSSWIFRLLKKNLKTPDTGIVSTKFAYWGLQFCLKRSSSFHLKKMKNIIEIKI